ENSIIGPDYVIPLAESDMQPSVHAAEKKRFRLSDPLFARHFEIPAGDDRESPDTPASPLWCDAILIGLGGPDRRYFRVRHDGDAARPRVPAPAGSHLRL